MVFFLVSDAAQTKDGTTVIYSAIVFYRVVYFDILCAVVVDLVIIYCIYTALLVIMIII